MNNLQNLEKLNSENYAIWKIQMRSVLIHNDLWSYVNGEEVINETAQESAKTKWKKNDEKALATICLAVSPSELIHISNCITSKQAWDTLYLLHTPRGPARKVMLFKRLVQLTMKEDRKMSEHLNEFHEIIEKLVELEIKMPEELLAIILLCSLSEKFENFVVAIETRDSLPSLSILKAKLLEEEQRHSEKNEDREVQHILLAKSKEKFEKKGRNASKNEKYGRKAPKCYACGKRGHIAATCRSKSQQEAAFSMNTNAISSKSNATTWYLDSGATSHICCREDIFTELHESETQYIQLATGETVKTGGIGVVKIKSSLCDLKLKNVLFVPEIKANFLSVSKITEAGYKIIFKVNSAVICDKNGNMILKIPKQGNLFVYNSKIESLSLLEDTKLEQVRRWHERFGHLNFTSLNMLHKDKMVLGMKFNDNHKDITCSVCTKGKISVQSFGESHSSKKRGILELIHSDLCGPIRTTSAGGAKYFITFIDDCSRKIFVYFLKSKNEVLSTFQKFKSLVEKETSKNIKMLRSDNGKEYVNKEFTSYLQSQGIRRQLTTEYTPQQNGVAERANRTIVEMARCLLISSKLPEYLWAEAVNTAVYLRNRSPTRAIKNKTPYEIWTGKKPTVNHLRIFGCRAIALNKKPGLSKFQSKGVECVMIGYDSESKAYRLYNPANRSILKSRDVVFFEKEYGNSSNSSTDNNYFFVDDSTVETQDSTCEENQSDSVPKIRPGRPKLVRTGKPGRPRKEYNLVNALVDPENIPNTPNTVREALSCDDAEKWKKSMETEFCLLQENETWELVDAPPDCHVIGCKWVFCIKRDNEGRISRYKSRLVAKGCAQRYPDDFFSTFSPVTRLSSVRLIIALSVQFKLLLHHVDVVSAYLNGIYR